MTPELKIACEVVFQEHKASVYPVTWNRDIFRGRISTGLSEMAKDTLIRKNIIKYPNPAKKILTVINPVVSGAATYEEAEDMILNKVPALAATIAVEHPTYVANHGSSFTRQPVTHRLLTVTGTPSGAITQDVKWYLKPLFVYVIWPVCAAIAGGLIAFLMGSAYTELVFDLK
ncbi:MAG: hypothetical protein ACXWV6_05415 [Chitinophagaceae bacterium]